MVCLKSHQNSDSPPFFLSKITDVYSTEAEPVCVLYEGFVFFMSNYKSIMIGNGGWKTLETWSNILFLMKYRIMSSMIGL